MNEKLIEKHQIRLNELQETLTAVMKDSVLPGFILLISMLTKMASMFGYDDVETFMTEDMDVLTDKLGNMTEEQQKEAETLYDVMCAQMDGDMSQIEIYEKMCEEAEIVQNVLEALTGGSSEF